jgi:hypothetical protein
MVKQPVKGDVSGTIRHWVKPLVSPRHSPFALPGETLYEQSAMQRKGSNQAPQPVKMDSSKSQNAPCIHMVR